ncbi:MAG TPA: hypothetical protein VIV40_35585 [Kofleriaceae bacterium]
MRWLAIVLAGCASAGTPDNAVVDSNPGGGSDGNQIVIDGSMTDGPSGPMTRTLTQTTSQTIKALNSVACPGSTSATTSSNNYYRVFDLPMMGITAPFNVTKVSFQIEQCQPTSGTTCTNVAVRVGTYGAIPGATLATANMTILASNATVPVQTVIETATSTPGGTVDAPITATIAAGAKLLVEVDAPNTGTYKFRMGSNDAGESGFGYVMAPDCAITVPTNISGMLGTTPAAPRHLLMTVTGTY